MCIGCVSREANVQLGECSVYVSWLQHRGMSARGTVYMCVCVMRYITEMLMYICVAVCVSSHCVCSTCVCGV